MTDKRFRKYLIHSSDTSQLPVLLSNAGCTTIGPGEDYPPGDHPFSYWFSWDIGRRLREFQLVFITGGGGVFESEHAGIHAIHESTVFLLLPGEWHRYRPNQETGWQEMWVGFGGRQAPDFVRTFGLTLSAPLRSVAGDLHFHALFQRLLLLVEEEMSGYQDHALALLAYIGSYLGFSALNNRYSELGIPPLVQHMQRALRSDVANTFNVADFCSKSGVSYSFGRRAFKIYTGMSPGQYRLQARLEEAKQMLAFSSLTIKEIAYKLGFESEQYFSRIFRKKSGCAPGLWRRQH